MTTLFVLLALLLGFGQGQPAAFREDSTRFDYQVRADFFAGFAGDEARLRKAMETCELVLADNPAHAEALVWHGSGWRSWRARPSRPANAGGPRACLSGV